MGNLDTLNQLMRTWLLSEDPYGTQGGTPTMQQPTMPDPRASIAGQAAVADALAPPPPPPPDPRAAAAGPDAVAQQLFGGQGSRYSEAERSPKAQAQGEQAVDRALAPSPTAEVDRTRGQMHGESAVDRALNPPTGSGAGFWAPGEAADTASAVGENAVAGALTKKARGKVARGRLKDPEDPDARQPE
jgi:hypothetical protein